MWKNKSSRFMCLFLCVCWYVPRDGMQAMTRTHCTWSTRMPQTQKAYCVISDLKSAKLVSEAKGTLTPRWMEK